MEKFISIAIERLRQYLVVYHARQIFTCLICTTYCIGHLTQTLLDCECKVIKRPSGDLSKIMINCIA